jgi:CubicO group peptidase (beta-lactamase class C family)
MNIAALQQVIHKAISQEGIIGATVLVAKKGQLIFKQHAGWADKLLQKPVNDQTLFRLASLTKPIVSATTLALVDQGVLALDVPITRWLPYFTPALSNGLGADITLRQLLNHTAGLSYGFLSGDNEPQVQTRNAKDKLFLYAAGINFLVMP